MERKKMERSSVDRIIEITNLVKQYDKETVVDDVNLNIRKGEFVTLLGPSGCGKTTILRMIAGFEIPTSGSIKLDGKDVTSIPPHKRPINTVFQKYALFPHLDVFNNIAFGLKLKMIPLTDNEKQNKIEKIKNKGDEAIAKKRTQLDKKVRRYTKKEIKEKVNSALTLVGLDDYGHRDVDSLSGGQQQRVAIARAIVMSPKVLLLDEPLGALDLKMRKEMQLELRRMHKELGITFIYVTHDQEEAMTMSDRIVVINDGQIQQIGTPKQIYETPSNAFVADFIGESNIIGGTMVADFKVKFLDTIFTCVDKGFGKNQPVDIVIRPEDIKIVPVKSKNAQLKGIVQSCTFVGIHYEKIVCVKNYEFTIQDTTASIVGSEVGLEFPPNEIHIMAMEATINEYKTEMASEDSVWIADEKFEITPQEEMELEKGTLVTASIPFDKVEITEDEEDGTVSGFVTNSIYKGTYYMVTVWADNDTRFIVTTPNEHDIDDRVGIKVSPEHIKLELREEIEEAE